MDNTTLVNEDNFFKVIMKQYVDGSIKFCVYRKYAKDEEIYLPTEAVEIMKQNLR